MPFWKEITKPFREVTRAVPILGQPAAIIIREAVRVADQATGPVQEPVKSLVNDVTGARERENKRLDEQTAQLIREAQQRVAANIKADQHNIRDLMEKEANTVRAAMENAERNTTRDPNVETNTDQAVIPNPFSAYTECKAGKTQELSFILRLDRTNETYNFFVSLNPLKEAYLFFIESEIISIDALRMLSTHNDTSINAAKKVILENIWCDLNDIVRDHNFNKAKRIILAGIGIEGEGVFLRKLDLQKTLHQPLIDANIISVSNGKVTLSGQQPKTNNAPKPRP